jgi:predicted RNase H-like nuclease
MVLDVPIGLSASGRRCDADARRLLKRRSSSVFTPPCRAAFSARTQAEASRLNIAAGGKGIGCQGFGILGRIAAVDRLMRPDLQEHVHEGHPEVSFAVIRGAPMKHPKKARDGERERLAVLATAGVRFSPDGVRAELGRSLVSRDDIIDAAVMLLAATRIEEGRAARLPSDVQERDERGLLMEMWA